MTESEVDEKQRTLEHNFRIHAASRLMLEHWKIAQDAAEKGLLSLFEEHKRLANDQEARIEELKKG